MDGIVPAGGDKVPDVVGMVLQRVNRRVVPVDNVLRRRRLARHDLLERVDRVDVDLRVVSRRDECVARGSWHSLFLSIKNDD